MKVVYITMQFPAPSEVFASNDVRLLKKNGIDISVISLKGRHNNSDQLIEQRHLSDIDIYCGSRLRLFYGLLHIVSRPLLMLKCLSWLIKSDWCKPSKLIKEIGIMPSCFNALSLVEKRDPDIVHLFWGHYPSVLGYLLKKCQHRSKLSMFLGAYDLHYGLGVTRSMISRADCLFTHANCNLSIIKNIFSSPFDFNVVYRGIDLTRIEICTQSLVKNKDSYLTVGRVLREKRFDKVISVFSKIHTANKSLKIVGEGPYIDELNLVIEQKQLSAQVDLLGYMSHSNVIDIMKESDYFIFLSNKAGECLPNVVKEAMLCGCICFVSKTPGIEELVINGETGFIFCEDEYDKIPQMAASLCEDRKNLIRAKAKKHIIDNFDANKSMQKYIEVWNNLLEGDQ